MADDNTKYRLHAPEPCHADSSHHAAHACSCCGRALCDSHFGEPDRHAKGCVNRPNGFTDD
jgi:hypothetical protein